MQQLVHIPVDTHLVEGLLVLPAAPIGLVVFAHGSGSSRHSPRNNQVAGVLHARQIGTLLIDIRHPVTGTDAHNRMGTGAQAGRKRCKQQHITRTTTQHMTQQGQHHTPQTRTTSTSLLNIDRNRSFFKV